MYEILDRLLQNNQSKLYLKQGEHPKDWPRVYWNPDDKQFYSYDVLFQTKEFTPLDPNNVILCTGVNLEKVKWTPKNRILVERHFFELAKITDAYSVYNLLKKITKQIKSTTQKGEEVILKGGGVVPFIPEEEYLTSENCSFKAWVKGKSQEDFFTFENHVTRADLPETFKDPIKRAESRNDFEIIANFGHRLLALFYKRERATKILALFFQKKAGENSTLGVYSTILFEGWRFLLTQDLFEPYIVATNCPFVTCDNSFGYFTYEDKGNFSNILDNKYQPISTNDILNAIRDLSFLLEEVEDLENLSDKELIEQQIKALLT